MSTTKNNFSKCGHKGRGAHCHRCADADRLEKLADVPQDKRTAFKDLDKAQLLAEAARLRGPQSTHRRLPEPTLPE